MPLVWQYGSNMDQSRLNSPGRLKGEAAFRGLAFKPGYKVTFPRRNKERVGTCSIAEGDPQDRVIGVLYDVPDDLIARLDQVEGVNSGSYRKLRDFQVDRVPAHSTDTVPTSEKVTTYLANEEPGMHPTSAEYANHILRGILDNQMAQGYFETVKGIILRNNPKLNAELIDPKCPFCKFKLKFTTTHFDNGDDPACETWIDFEYDDEGELSWYAVLNGNQYTAGHCMVILGRHRRKITDHSLTNEEAEAIGRAVARVSRRLSERLGVPAVHALSLCEGVEHLHYQLVPRGEYSLQDKLFCYQMFWDREVRDEHQPVDQGLIRQHRFKARVFEGGIHGMWYSG